MSIPSVGRRARVRLSVRPSFRVLIVPAAVLALPLDAAAQPMPDVVVTATRTPRSVEQTLADVTVIDAKAIADAGATSLPELLQRLGGVEVGETGGAGKVSGLFVRGTRNSQTVVLVDGIRLENALSGGGNLEFIPLSVIDRIEVVRGPMSSLYGSGAIGGVVQIFTRGGEPGAPRRFASAGIGSQGTTQLRAGFSGAAGEGGATRFSIAAASDRTRGWDATLPGSKDRQVDDDGNRQWSFNASLSHRLSAKWEVGANLMNTRGTAKYDDAFSTPDTAKWRYASRSAQAWAKGEVMPGWETTARVGVTTVEYAFDAFTFAPSSDSRTLSWQNAFALPVGRLLAGVEQVSQSIAGDGVTRDPGGSVYLRDTRSTESVFGGWELEQGAHALRLQARHDRIQGFGSQPTGLAAYGYKLGGGWLARGSIGSAFRAPTFDDLYNPFGSNPALRAEKSTGVEAAIERRREGSVWKVVAFASRIRDAIELDANFIPQNLGAAKVRGVTFEAAQPLGGGFSARGSLTLQHTEGDYVDAATGATATGRLARRARQYGQVALDWRGGPWRAGAQVVAQGDRVDTDRNAIPGYGLLHLYGGYAVDRHWELFGRVSNVGDATWQTVGGYRGAPRAVFVGVRFDG